MELQDLDVVELFELRFQVDKQIAMRDKLKYDTIIEERKKQKKVITQVNFDELINYINESLSIDLRYNRRSNKFTFPRFSFFLIMNMEHDISLKELSRVFDCHHTSVLSGINTAMSLLEERNHDNYPLFLQSYTSVKKLINEHINNQNEQ